MDAVDTLERPAHPTVSVTTTLTEASIAPSAVSVEARPVRPVTTPAETAEPTGPTGPPTETVVDPATEPATGRVDPTDERGDTDQAGPLDQPVRAERGRRSEAPSVIDDPEALELADLVHRARAGDRTAFVGLVERCRPLVTRVARRYLANPADAEDVVQEVWLSLYEHLDRIHSPELVRSWLCRVTANAALRSQTRSSRVVLGPDVGEGPSGESTEDLGLRRAAQEELSEAMGEALGRLRPQDSRLVALLMTEDRPDYRLVSAMVDRPVGSIGPTRQRILERLRRDPAIANLRVSGPIVA